MSRSLVVSVALLCAMFCLAGCGPGFGGRKEVSGTVTFKGQPLDNGSISFFPLSGDGATKSGAAISNGGYKVPAASGLFPGKYRVSITAGDGRTREGAADDAPPGPTGANIVSKDRIPKEFNIESKLDVEVTEKGPNVFDYNIP